MKLFISEGRYEDDMAVARHLSKWLEPDPEIEKKTKHMYVTLDVTCFDPAENEETGFEFDVYNEKNLSNDDFEDYINKNATLLAQQQCEEESCEFIRVENIEYHDIESDDYEDDYEDDFYDPYAEY